MCSQNCIHPSYNSSSVQYFTLKVCILHVPLYIPTFQNISTLCITFNSHIINCCMLQCKCVVLSHSQCVVG